MLSSQGELYYGGGRSRLRRRLLQVDRLRFEGEILLWSFPDLALGEGKVVAEVQQPDATTSFARKIFASIRAGPGHAPAPIHLAAQYRAG